MMSPATIPLERSGAILGAIFAIATRLVRRFRKTAVCVNIPDGLSNFDILSFFNAAGRPQNEFEWSCRFIDLILARGLGGEWRKRLHPVHRRPPTRPR
jgi:hypothetical protein